MKNSWFFLCIITGVRHQQKKVGGQECDEIRDWQWQEIWDGRDLEQHGLYKGVNSWSSIRTLLSDILEGLSQGREHLGACIGNTTFPKAA